MQDIARVGVVSSIEKDGGIRIYYQDREQTTAPHAAVLRIWRICAATDRDSGISHPSVKWIPVAELYWETSGARRMPCQKASCIEKT